ncbi:uncharacterized protein LOC126366414 [Pectinophora gossypiella]|uniref:uncharacterized protein LOC126366414 n=1 Tax=Pectinophora gossypiella TaxID=13191 RepID=UPI00214E9506|nr:uncharacterized protein LOC126366414 [Pectinophora gossypiella]
MHQTIGNISYYYSLFSMILAMSGMVLFNASPIITNIKNGAFTSQGSENMFAYSIHFSFPGFNPMEYFTPTTIYNFYLSYVCAANICAMDLLLFLMVFQIVGHILILRNNFEILPKPKRMVFDTEENEIVRKKLIACIDHHREIFKFTEELSTFFGPVLGFNYAYHMCACCLLMMECSQGDVDAIIRFGPLTIIAFGQLVQMSVIFEIVDTVSEKLKDSVYDVPWESMDTRNCRLVIILLNRVQSPLHVTAMGITPVGVTTMAGILKTTFSYYAFLRSASA